MKNIKAIIYDILKSDPSILSIIWNEEQIFYQSDDRNENRAKASFDIWKSFITYYRISEKPWDYPKVSSMFQITCWNKDNLIAENLKNALVWVFNRMENQDVSYTKLVEIWQDIYDKDLNVYWIPLTFIFIYRDETF